MLVFRNGFEYRNSDLQMLNGNIFATLYANLITIDPLTSKIARGVSVTFGKRRQKSAYPTKYLSKYWTALTIFGTGRHMYKGYKTDISFAVTEGTLLW